MIAPGRPSSADWRARIRSARRIRIVGGPGSGKSTLARTLGAQLDVPAYDLDEVAFEGPHFGIKPLESRLGATEALAQRDSWIAEGIFLGWSDELFRAADVIIWLDHIGWVRAIWRILRRFARGAAAGVQREAGLRKVTRFGDYWRNFRQFLGVVRSTRNYYGSRECDPDARLPTRKATRALLAPYASKVRRCTSQRDVDELLRVGERSRTSR